MKVRVIRMKRRSDGYIHDVEVDMTKVKVGRSYKNPQEGMDKIANTIRQEGWDMISSFDRERDDNHEAERNKGE